MFLEIGKFLSAKDLSRLMRVQSPLSVLFRSDLRRKAISEHYSIVTAIEMGRVELIDILLESNVPTKAEISDALLVAIDVNNIGLAERLLNRGANVYHVDGDGSTSMIRLIDSDHCNPEMARLLVAHGYDLDYSGKAGAAVMPVMHATIANFQRPETLDLLRLWVELGADPNQLDSKRRNALDYFYVMVTSETPQELEKAVEDLLLSLGTHPAE